MYINYDHLYSKGLTDDDFHLLQKIFQKEEVLLEPLTEQFSKLDELGLIQYLKNQEGTAKGVRISKKGKSFMSQLETLSYNDSVGLLVDNLIGQYEAVNKHIGTKLEVQNRLMWFLGNTGFSSKVIIKTVEEYLAENSTYVKSLENLIWTPPSKAFSIHMNLKDSKLFDLVCKKYRLDETFFIESNNTKEMEWLQGVTKLVTSKSISKDYFFTGSYKTDMEHIEKLKAIYLKKIRG